MSRYHPAQVVLHWLSAVLVIVGWVLGAIVLERIPAAESTQKLFVLGSHMAVGITIAFVVALRLALRFALEQPPRATVGNALLDRLAAVVHGALYLAALAMAASGLVLAVQAGLPAVVIGGGDLPLPARLDDYGAREVHEVIGSILITLVALHALAALYHQLVRRDGLFARMWFGARGV